MEVCNIFHHRLCRACPGMATSMLFFCIMQSIMIYAAASPSLSASADAADVAEGSYVNISINLSGNPSISTLGAALSYDNSVLSYESASWNSGFSGSDMKIASDTGSEVNLSVVCDSSYSADGTVVTVRFQAVSDSSSIPVTLSLRDMADADMDAVTECKVSSQVRVPETAGGKDDSADKRDDKADLGSQETGKADRTEGKSNLSEQQAVNAASADTGNAQSASNTAAASTQRTEAAAGSRVQHLTVQNVQSQSAPASDAGSAKPDQSYKTGAGLGSDIFLVIAAAFGILALMLAVRKHGEEKK